MPTPRTSFSFQALLLSSFPLFVACSSGSSGPQSAPADPQAASEGVEHSAAEMPAKTDSIPALTPSDAGLPPLLSLPAEPKAALAALRQASEDGPVLVFKHSPICPVSAAANDRFHGWLGSVSPEAGVRYAHIDVLAEKPLARGLVAELDIKHESPQALLFVDGELEWHDSHGAITSEAIDAHLPD